MQYLLIICHDDSFAPPEGLVAEIMAWTQAMAARGILVYGNPLRPPGDARTVRVRNGQVAVTEGPFAQSEEKICAYDLIECGSLEEAVEVASQHPMARVATIEVRPVWSGLA